MEKVEQAIDAVERPQQCVGIRHLITVMLFLSTSVAYAVRVSMSMGIVAMTNPNDHGYPVFDWDLTTRDTILSSFFWGYIVLQIPAGMIAARVGGKQLILAAVLCNGVMCMVLPYAAINSGWLSVVACRVVMGLTQGLIYPSVHGVLGQWSPAPERSRMGTFVYAGSLFGTIVEMALAGVLSASPWGWPSIFYTSGICCLIWCVLWIFLGSSSPAQNRWISKEERKYIETTSGSHDLTEKKHLPTPWGKIFTSLPFWAILISHSGQSLGYWTLLTEMPSYMSSVLGVNIKSNGLLSALPYVAMYLLSFLFSWAADFIVNRNIVSLATSRKIFNTIALWGPAAALLALSYLPAGNLAAAVGILTVTVGLNGAHYVGFLISHIDLSPNFASTLMGITNGCGNIFSIMAPYTVSLFVTDVTSAHEWRKVFFVAVAFYFLSNLFYLLFMSGEIQEWNEPKVQDDIENAERDRKTSEASKNSTVGHEKF